MLLEGPLLSLLVVFVLSLETSAQSCSPLQGNELASADLAITVGLVPLSLVTIQNEPFPNVQLLQFNIVCEASASVSVVVEYKCQGFACPGAPNPSITRTLVTQFEFECDTSRGIYQPPADRNVSLPASAGLNTTRDTGCEACVSPLQNPSADPITHCLRSADGSTAPSTDGASTPVEATLNSPASPDDGDNVVPPPTRPPQEPSRPVADGLDNSGTGLRLAAVTLLVCVLIQLLSM